MKKYTDAAVLIVFSDASAAADAAALTESAENILNNYVKNHDSSIPQTLPVYCGFTDAGSIKRIKRSLGLQADTVQAALERIKTDGFMYTYIIPEVQKNSRDYDILLEEIDARISYGCFSDIILCDL